MKKSRKKHKNKPRPKRPLPLKWDFEPGIPTDDFFEGRDPSEGYSEALENFIFIMNHGEFLAWEAVMAQDPFECPRDFKPGKKLNPRVACLSKWRKLECLQNLKDFLDAYRDAWLDFQNNVKKAAMFPAGTYWMRRHAGCATASPP